MLFNFVLVWLYNYFDLSVTDESYVDETRLAYYIEILVPLITINSYFVIECVLLIRTLLDILKTYLYLGDLMLDKLYCRYLTYIYKNIKKKMWYDCQ